MNRDSDGEEDELSSPSITSLRVTPRQAVKRSASEALGSSDTPYSNLRRLAYTIRPNSSTPKGQRAPSVSAASDSRAGTSASALRRNNGAATGIGKYPRPVPAKRSAPSTPHAIRALEQRRRAALTPSRERRRSGRQQRDSPRDILRNLSRVLAAKAQAQANTTQPQTPPTREDVTEEEDSDEDELQDAERSRPRLSLPIDVDDSLELPPEMSALDEEVTVRSIEAGRRAVTEPFARGPSRLSEGLVLTPEGKIQPTAESPFRVRDSLDLSIAIDDSLMQDLRQGDDTEDLRRMVFRQRGNSPQGRSMQETEEMRNNRFDDSTFRFDIPFDIPLDEVEKTPMGQGPTGPLDEKDVAESSEEEDEDEDARPLANMNVDETSIGSDAEAPQPNPDEMGAPQARKIRPPTKRLKKAVRNSRWGIPAPSLPQGVVKRVASSFARSSGTSRGRVSKDVLTALSQASDWYFEQLADDLGAYSKHARRKVIEEADVITLMKRQRLLSATSTPFSLAQKFLPRELLQEMRMAPPKDDVKKPRGKRKQAALGVEDDEEDGEEDDD